MKQLFCQIFYSVFFVVEESHQFKKKPLVSMALHVGPPSPLPTQKNYENII